MLQPNTDIIVGAADGTGFFVDDRFVCECSDLHSRNYSISLLSKRYASARTQPPEDPSQDITNTTATLQNGFTTVNFTRPRSSTDSNDISLDGQNRYLLFAYGTTVNVAARSISYHGSTRGVLQSSFCLPPLEACPVGM